jgi:secondary thiamine-phosphate synthase enzyme
MRTHQTRCQARTRATPDFVDLTELVQEALERSGIADGQVTVFNPNRGCTLIVNERESGLLRDIAATLARLKVDDPVTGRTMIGSSSVVLPAVAGRLRLGTWQRLFLVELEGAADRPVVVQIVGE